MDEKFWKIIETNKGFAGNWIDINLDKILLPDNSQIEFEAIEFHRHGAGIAAENENGEFILVKNFRYINDYYSWEVPAGTIPPDVDPADCIIEELKEEAGCVLDKKDLVYTGNYYPSIGSSNQKFYCFYGKGVRKIFDDLDGNEIIEAKWFSKEELVKMIQDGEIKDGFTLYLLLRALSRI